MLMFSRIGHNSRGGTELICSSILRVISRNVNELLKPGLLKNSCSSFARVFDPKLLDHRTIVTDTYLVKPTSYLFRNVVVVSTILLLLVAHSIEIPYYA